jgi:predicted nucleic acid-binding Zn ribbon protein
MSNLPVQTNAPGMPHASENRTDLTQPKQARGGKQKGTKSTRRKMLHCKHCKVSFRGILGQQYCSTSCREKAAYRRKHPVQRVKKPKPAPVLEPRTCTHCGDSFWAKQPNQRFCCSSCKVLAYRARRVAAIRALQAVYGMERTLIEDIADEMGAAKLQAILRGLGYDYDERSRQWWRPLQEEADHAVYG